MCLCAAHAAQVDNIRSTNVIIYVFQFRMSPEQIASHRTSQSSKKPIWLWLFVFARSVCVRLRSLRHTVGRNRREIAMLYYMENLITPGQANRLPAENGDESGTARLAWPTGSNQLHYSRKRKYSHASIHVGVFLSIALDTSSELGVAAKHTRPNNRLVGLVWCVSGGQTSFISHPSLNRFSHQRNAPRARTTARMNDAKFDA